MNQRTLLLDMLQEIAHGDEVGQFAIGFTSHGRGAIKVIQGYQSGGNVPHRLFDIDLQDGIVSITPNNKSHKAYHFDIHDPVAWEEVKGACTMIIKLMLVMPTLTEMIEKNYPNAKIVDGYPNEAMGSAKMSRGPAKFA